MDNDQNTKAGTQSPGPFEVHSEEILESFIAESSELMEQLGSDLLEMEKTPRDREVINKVFRTVHTLKGTSAFLGYSQLTELAHGFEDLLNKARKEELLFTSEVMDVALEAADLMKNLLHHIEIGETGSCDTARTLEKLNSAATGNFQVTPEEILGNRHPAGYAEPKSAPSRSVADTTVRVDVGRLDDLMNLVGELVLDRNRLLQLTPQLVQHKEQVQAVRDVHEISFRIDRITSELQMAIMKTRMVPVGRVFKNLPRLVRDLARETGKEVELQVWGEETELDKSIIEVLTDPLVHLVRNAVDHGIEMPPEREELKKSRCGTIHVNARHDGNTIVLTIQDDGRGMSPEELKKKAVDKGILSRERADEMSEREALGIIFAPGFSTASAVTSVSGRGVGMDVVRTNIARLKGMIEIFSEEGKGTTFVIKLPLTLAIIQGLLVNVGPEVFAIPLSSVLEVVRIHTDEIQSIQGNEVMRLRDLVLPLVRMDRILGISANQAANGQAYVVVAGLAEERLGIMVDGLEGQQEIVVKSLGEYLDWIPGLAGSTILGNGRPVLIVDVGQLIRPESRKNA